MRLEALLSQNMQCDAAHADVEITGLTADSRIVAPGYLFAALPGEHVDGNRFVAQAVAQGAAAVLTAQPDAGLSVPVLYDENPRRALAELAGRFFAFRPECTVGITGTNGKTSTAAFLRQFWTEAGLSAASLGTLGVVTQEFTRPINHTTPDPVTLHAALRDLYARGIDHLAMEVSSHALAQHRVDGLDCDVAGFTNLTRDHLDYHGDTARYFEAKARLFTEILKPGGVGVVQMRGPMAPDLAAAARAKGRQVYPVGGADAALKISVATRAPDGMVLVIEEAGNRVDVHVPLIGDFQVENLEVAMGLGLHSGLDFEQMAGACNRLQGVAGRMQLAGIYQGAAIYVDYAHTPDALSVALLAVRQHVTDEGRVLLVFGCGGDRDTGKRPQMGAIAAKGADQVFVTDDNPRSENPADIRRAIMDACPDALEFDDRHEAIAAAIDAARVGDIVLVAGKGHEQGQIIGDTILPFDDVTVIAEHIGLEARP